MKKKIAAIYILCASLFAACGKKYQCIDKNGNIVAEVRASSAEKACAQYLDK